MGGIEEILQYDFQGIGNYNKCYKKIVIAMVNSVGNPESLLFTLIDKAFKRLN